MFSVIALKLVSDPEQRAVDGGAIIASQFHDAGFDDESAEFDEMPCALATCDLPSTHVMSRLCGLMPVARRPSVQERCLCCAELLVHFAAPGFERTRPRAWPMPPFFRPRSSRPARSAHPLVRWH